MIVLVNAVHNGTNVLEEYIIFHITHIDGLCLTPDQHAQVNCLNELSLAKSNHIIIDGFDPDEITDIINAIATG